jgi:hypothetical protein
MIGGTLFSAAVAYYVALRKGRRDAQSTEKADVVKRLTELERQLGIVGAQVAPFNTAFQSILIKQLTHAHTPYQDALMEKLGEAGIPPTITEAEEDALIEVLKKIAADPAVPDDERDAAKMLPIQMRRVKRDAEALIRGDAKMVDIQVVGRIESIGETKE